MSLDLTHPFIIAEAGTCHANTDRKARVKRAKAYVKAAAKTGVDAVKFQIFANPIKDDMFCWINGDEARALRWRGSVMSVKEWQSVKALADELGIVFLASVFQDRTVDWLNGLGVAATKVASRAAKDFPYGKSPAPYLVSDGMHPLPKRNDVIGLECEAQYPSAAWWQDRLTGFSDHSADPARAIDALERGCKLIEVHFFVKPEDAGPDLPASLTTDEVALICAKRDTLRGGMV